MSRFADPIAAPRARKPLAPAAKQPPKPSRPSPQHRVAMAAVIQRRAAERVTAEKDAKTPSSDGLPARLRAGIEALSGLAMDDVRVHRDSPEPARLGALAFTQGSDIHLGHGQEQHLPHEAWHVVQQKHGRVRATVQAYGTPINDDARLEREADAMGARAVFGPLANAAAEAQPTTVQRTPAARPSHADRSGIVQKVAIEMVEIPRTQRYRRNGPPGGEVGVRHAGAGRLEILPLSDAAEGLSGSLDYEMGDRATLFTIITDPEGSGLGRMLMREFARTARAAGHAEIFISLPAPTAVPSYLAMGAISANPDRHALRTAQYLPVEGDKLRDSASDAAEQAALLDNPLLPQDEREQVRAAAAQAREQQPDFQQSAQRAASHRAYGPEGMIIAGGNLIALENTIPHGWQQI